MKSYLRWLALAVTLGWAPVALADTPIESYLFNPPGGQATSTSGLRIPAVSSPNASTMQWVSPSILGGGGGGSGTISGLTSGQIPIANGPTSLGSSIPLGSGVQSALSNSLNASGGLVGFSGSLGTPTQLNLANATGLPLAGIATGLSGTQCVHSVSGVLAGTGSDCGSGGGSSGLSGMVPGQVPIAASASTISSSFPINSGTLTALGNALNATGGLVEYGGNIGAASATSLLASSGISSGGTPLVAGGFFNAPNNAGYAAQPSGGGAAHPLITITTGNHIAIGNSTDPVDVFGTALTVPGLAGAGTYCVQVSPTTGALSNTGAPCGSGSGAVNSVAGTTGQINTTPTTGSVVVSLPTIITQAENFTGGLQSSGAAVLVNGGALGTPSSGSAANLTGLPIANITTGITGTQCIHSVSGVLSGTGSDCGTGSGGSGTVSSGLANQLAMYASNGTTVSGLVTAANGVVYTNSGGVPSVGSTLPSGLNIPSPTLATPNIGVAIGTSLLASGSISAGGAPLITGGFDAANNAGYGAQSSGGTPHSLITLSTTNRVSIGNGTDAVDVFGTSLNVPGLAGVGTYCLQVSPSTGALSNTGTPCGTGAGIGTVSDTYTHSVTAATSLALGAPFQVNSGTGAATANMVVPDSTKTASYQLAAGDMAGQVNFNGSSLTATIPAVGSGVWNPGATAIVNNLGTASLAVTNTATVNGCGTTLYPGGFFSYTSNTGATALDCFGFPGFGALLNQANTFVSAQTFGEVHPTSYTPTLTSHNYTAQVSDCGKTLLLPTETTPTITLPNINPANGSCIINAVETTSTQYTPQAASGGTLTANVNSFTKTKGTGAFVSFILTTPSSSAAVWMWSGDGA